MTVQKSTLVLPDDLRPADGRFGSGPSKVRQEGGAARAGLAELRAPPAGYEVALGNGGSTLFWDLATFSLIERRSQHLVFGEFSAKFAAAATAAPHLDAPQVLAS